MARYMARATKAAPISLSAFSWRPWWELESSHNTTVEAPISMRLSRPKPARATDLAPTAAMASTTMPMTFHPNVTPSRTKARRTNTSRSSPVNLRHRP